MKGSYHIATVFGIPVRIHWSFGLLVFIAAYFSSRNGFDLTVFFSQLILFLSIFFCVVLHEFGHALVAKRFGVRTYDIIMTPIGGIARLERMPEGRGQEFWVAIAGPFVNFIIAALIWLGFALTIDAWSPIIIENWTYNAPVREYFFLLMIANLYLGLFNLLPAFPMDGGRILRSLLSLWIERTRATQIASVAGQVIAVAMFAWAWYTSQPILTLIAVFIFFTARQENRVLQKQALMNKVRASDLMEPIEHNVFTGQKLSAAKEAVKSSRDESFIVWSRPGIPAGYITRDSIDFNSPENAVDAFVIPAPAVVAPETSAAQLLSFMQQHKIPLALVSDNSHYLGVVPWKKVVDLLR